MTIDSRQLYDQTIKLARLVTRWVVKFQIGRLSDWWMADSAYYQSLCVQINNRWDRDEVNQLWPRLDDHRYRQYHLRLKDVSGSCYDLGPTEEVLIIR